MRAIQRQQFESRLSDSYDSLTRETWFNTTHPLCGQQIYRRVQPIRPLSISVDSKVWKWICRPPYSLTGHLLSYSYFRNCSSATSSYVPTKTTHRRRQVDGGATSATTKWKWGSAVHNTKRSMGQNNVFSFKFKLLLEVLRRWFERKSQFSLCRLTMCFNIDIWG